MFETIIVPQGLIIGETLVFVILDLLAFLITLLLLLRVGNGQIFKPILFFALSFLIPAVVYVFYGPKSLWVIPILQTILGLVGIYLFMKILGVFDLISQKYKK